MTPEEALVETLQARANAASSRLRRDLLRGLVDDRRRLAVEGTPLLTAILDLAAEGFLKIRVTRAGLANVAKDGLVRVRGVDHLVTCEVVELAARGARRRGDCTCGSLPG